MIESEPRVPDINTSEIFAKLMTLAIFEADRRERIHTTQTRERVVKEIFPSVPLQEKS